MAGAQQPERHRVRDFGTRKVQRANGDRSDSRSINLPAELRDTAFDVGVGQELRVELREPENELVMRPKEE